ncbi:MAG: ribosome silencing factor [Synergistota bacterium]|nr:ribosome silencing factor [Synergistota bacterium]
MMTSSKTIEEFYAPYKPIVDALIEKHALEVTVHNLSEVSGFTEAFIVAIARSDLHAKTLLDTASEMLDEMKLPHKVEGEGSSRWCLMDAGHLVVNILSREGRDYYRLDSLWGDAPALKFQDQDE